MLDRLLGEDIELVLGLDPARWGACGPTPASSSR